MRLFQHYGRAVATALALLAAAPPYASSFGGAIRKLDALTHLTPLFALALLVLAPFAIVLKRAPLLRLAVALGLFCCVLRLAPDLSAPNREPALAPNAPTLKFIQHNISNRTPDAAGLQALIRAEAPDVICVEEVRPDMRAAVRAAAPGYVVAASRRDDRDRTDYLLTRLAIVKSLPSSDIAAAARLALPQRLGGAPFDALCTHLRWPVPSQRQWTQTSRLLAYVRSELRPERAMIGGDFNLTPWSWRMRRLDAAMPLQRRTRALATWPARPVTKYGLHAPAALLPIDHVYAGPDWRLVSIRRGQKTGSDHYPIVVVLAPAPQLAPSVFAGKVSAAMAGAGPP